MAVFDLSEKCANYGKYEIMVQSTAEGYEPSDPVLLTYYVGATIENTMGVFSVTAANENVTAFGIYIDGILYKTVEYTGASDWNVDLDGDENVEDGQHMVYFCAVGDGLSAENRSNTISWYKGVDPDFATASWESIKNAVLGGVASEFYAVGTTKTITLKNGNTVTLRVANNSGDIYERADGSNSGCVLEFVDLWPTNYYMNDSSTNAGGWDASYMRNTVMPLIWEQLPDDLQSVIATVKIKAAKSGNDGTLVESMDTLFLPAEREVFGSRSYGRTEEWNALQRWQYYAQNDTNAARVKQRSGSAAWWWLRSPRSGSSNGFVCVGSFGSVGNITAYNSGGVAPSFCI